MEFLHAAIAMLASMVLVLAGMVGYLYWQQTRMFQNMNSIALVIGDLAQSFTASRATLSVASLPTPAPAREPEAEPEAEDEDDRASVEKTPDVVTGPPETLDTDTLPDKTKKELQDILTKRGLPFSKSDGKSALISLLKATA
jgi:hypothetical protein